MPDACCHRATADLVRTFEDGTRATLTHVDHVRVAWHALREAPLWEVMRDLPRRLRRFARAKGAPRHYHETITMSFVVVIHERVQRADAPCWCRFARAHPDLLQSSFLRRYYASEVLSSELARRVFVLPDPGEPT